MLASAELCRLFAFSLISCLRNSETNAAVAAADEGCRVARREEKEAPPGAPLLRRRACLDQGVKCQEDPLGYARKLTSGTRSPHLFGRIRAPRPADDSYLIIRRYSCLHQTLQLN